MTRFTALPLLPHEIDRAFPLVQLMMPKIDRRRWARFARGFVRRSAQRGILSVRDHRGYIRGLAIFRRQIDIAGPVLFADPVLFVDLLDASEVGLILIEALEEKARACHCAGIRINLSERDALEWPLANNYTQVEVQQLRKMALFPCKMAS